MIKLRAITLFLIGFVNVSPSQSDTTKSKLKFGVGLNPLLYIDYDYFKNANITGDDWMPNRPDLCFNVSKNRHTFEIGVMGGVSDPVMHFLNYYVGYNCRITPKKWKFEVLGNTKWMAMHYQYKGKDFTETMEAYTCLLGGTIQKTFRGFQLGICYFAKFGTYKLTEQDISEPKFSFSYFRTGFVNTGLLELKLNVIIKE